MQLENLGTTKAVLKVGKIQLLFSNGKPIALYDGEGITQDSKLYKRPPNSTRHAKEWASSLGIKESDIYQQYSVFIVRTFFLLGGEEVNER